MKPILFNTEMVKAILDGRKMQTRRVVNKEYLGLAYIDGNNIYIEDEDGNHFNILETSWAKYKVGDILWVREPVKVTLSSPYDWKMSFKYLADDSNNEFKNTINIPDRFIGNINCSLKEWYIKPSWIRNCQGVPNGCIKEMARIFLKVTNVRVERLQDIDNDGIFAEGFKPYSKNILLESLKNKTLSKLNDDVKDWWINFWNSTAKDGYKWEDNPYVFVYEFESIAKED